jgi:hypothetical protein
MMFKSWVQKQLAKTICTGVLSRELETREGVESHWVRPYEDFELKVNGPAVVLINKD